jgi:hypothetical protein
VGEQVGQPDVLVVAVGPMALYVAICPLGVVTTVVERADAGHADVFAIVWAPRWAWRWPTGSPSGSRRASSPAVRSAGTTPVGRRAARRRAGRGGARNPADRGLPATSELDVVRLLFAGFIAGVGFAVARAGGAGTARSAGLRGHDPRGPLSRSPS